MGVKHPANINWLKTATLACTSAGLGPGRAMLAELLLAAGVALLFHRLYWVCRVMWLTRNMPGPFAYPIIGNCLCIMGPLEGLYQRVKTMSLLYSTSFMSWVGPFPALFTTTAEDIQVVFTSPHITTKPRLVYCVTDPILGAGLVSLRGGTTYMHHRKAIQPSFHIDQLQKSMSSFNRNARLMTEEMKVFPEDAVVDMTALCGRCATRSACDNLLVVDTSLLEREIDEYVKMSHEAAMITLFLCLRPWYLLPGVFRILSPDLHAKYWQAAAYIQDFARKVLRIKEEQLKGFERGNSERRFDWLLEQLAREAGTGLSHEELEDEIKTILFTSIMTSTDFLSFFVMAMSVLPDVQRKVQEELHEVFGDDEHRDVRVADLPRLQYTECVMMEVLRMFPVVPVFARQAQRDVPLSSGVTIPEGSYVGILAIRTHEDERWFPRPSEFRPERFLPENSQGRPQHAFVAFSGGKRVCMGQRYAMMFGKTVIATLLRKYDIAAIPGGPTTLKDIPIMGGMSLSVHGNAKVAVSRRPHT